MVDTNKPSASLANSIRALIPRDSAGHQFVCYADSCSGVPGGPHEATFAAVNAVVAQLSPQPEFICFPGDEIRGLTVDGEELRRQWRYWLEQEMGWLDRHPGANLAIVTHGTVMTLLIARAAGLDPFALWQSLGLPAFAVLSWPDLALLQVVESVDSPPLPGS
jgi:broad specificity phosphatase PhoE